VAVAAIEVSVGRAVGGGAVTLTTLEVCVGRAEGMAGVEVVVGDGIGVGVERQAETIRRKIMLLEKNFNLLIISLSQQSRITAQSLVALFKRIWEGRCSSTTRIRFPNPPVHWLILSLPTKSIPQLHDLIHFLRYTAHMPSQESGDVLQ
jgi:hypothetical protein